MSGSGLFSDQGARLPHLVEGKGGVPGEVDDLRRDVARVLGPLAALALDDFGDAALDVADVDAIKDEFSSAAGAATFSGSDLDGVVGTGTMSPPRNITIDTTVAATGYTDCTVTGTDIDGNVLTEDFTGIDSIGQVVGTKLFASVTELAFTGGTDAAATHAVGFGDLVGLKPAPLALASLAAPALIHEVVDTAVVTSGALSLPATNPPYGAYIPSGGVAAVKYAIIYPYNPTA